MVTCTITPCRAAVRLNSGVRRHTHQLRAAAQETKQMISAVLFDFDGVLTTDKTGSITTIRYLSAKTGLDEQKIWSAFASFNDDLLYGLATHSEIWPAFCIALGQELDIALLTGAFESTPMNKEMLDLARGLKTAGYSIGIVTDNKKDRIDCLRAHLELDSLFSPIVVSAECGSGKDGPAIFNIALAQLDVKADQTIFIDNSKRNLVAAEAIGIKTIHFDDSTNDVQGLAAALEWQHGVTTSSGA